MQESTISSELRPDPGAAFEHTAAPAARPVIVVAEDDDELRFEICAALEDVGFMVVPVADGEALVGFLGTCEMRGAPPDLILSDNLMPGYSGLEVLQTLTEQGWTTPVIITSGYGDEESAALAFAYGARAYLPKPLDFGRLQEEVLTHIEWLGPQKRRN